MKLTAKNLGNKVYFFREKTEEEEIAIVEKRNEMGFTTSGCVTLCNIYTYSSGILKTISTSKTFLGKKAGKKIIRRHIEYYVTDEKLKKDFYARTISLRRK